ncbi:histidine--tRNA ligase [[Mycoplasma] anseris]|uniref:Histidine--tRNA ligase n=2 Tax=[Mycoplasma] anseris TaxID=92400 RepID=A0A2Z4NCE0_9BACT|nr:histidine--tRNA ligase [[Mycoplasma] anseris]
MFNKLKGTRDIYSIDADILNFIRNIFFETSRKYNFQYIETPIIEETSLFIRSAGETSDIVSKEMYSFLDNGKRNISLRPEGTASTIRAFVENKINNLDSSKLFYFGPMFRYERPQKGRYRQFIQGGIEKIEKVSSDLVLSNFEIIKFAFDFLSSLKIKDFILEINNLGSLETRNKYIKILKEYFLNFKDQLSEISLVRLEKNVLRILDDKTEANKDFVKNAPKLIDYLNEEEKAKFNDFIYLLDLFKINYQINPNLVRGLDYYNDLVFEFVSESEALGSKSTILAGGRYNGMIQDFGGPNLNSIGFAFGVDRLMEIIKSNLQNYEELNIKPDILIGYLNQNEKEEILKMTYELRKEFNVELINKTIDIKELFRNYFKIQPKVLLFKELNMNKNEIKIKNDRKELTIEFNTIDDFKKAIIELE